MTTIAYRDGVLAADTLVTNSGASVGTCSKIMMGPDGVLAAGAGIPTYVRAFFEWVRGMYRYGDPPPEHPNGEGMGVLVTPEGELRIYEPGGWFALDAPYWAAGSGREIALGAMHAGASAEDAVRAAIAHDTSTGGEVQSVRLGRLLVDTPEDGSAQAEVEGHGVKMFGSDPVIRPVGASRGPSLLAERLRCRPATIDDRRADGTW